ncbi:YidB family protein, partial [Proteus mirabilis]|uniref:YidB family protein n=2 Tax=Pseudomonadota TaxID=1224 RepID=UPI001EF75DDD
NQQGGAAGGIGGVLETLAANGMADHVASWLGDGHNLPISTDQLRSALGNEQVQQMASSLGLPVDDFL